MKILIAIVSLVVLAVLVLFVGGSLVSREHRASRAARYKAPPSDVFGAITDFASHPSWRKGLKQVEILPPRDGRTVIREVGGSQPMTMEVVELVPPKKLVMRIADDTLPFGGTWTFALEPDGGGTRLAITEDGFVGPPPFRFLARFVFGYTKTIEDYLRALGKRFGEDVEPEPA